MIEPRAGTIRIHHAYVSVVVPFPAETAALRTEQYVRGAVADPGGTVWSDPLPTERPATARYWPRLSVYGSVAGRRHRVAVELEVWPWDDASAELGIRPRLVRRRFFWAPDAEWVGLATAALRQIERSVVRFRNVAERFPHDERSSRDGPARYPDSRRIQRAHLTSLPRVQVPSPLPEDRT